MLRRLPVLALLLLFLAAPLLARDPKPGVPPETKKAVDALVGQLDNAAVEAREQATKELMAMGPAILPALLPAMDHLVPEVRRRVRRVVLFLREEERLATVTLPVKGDWPALKGGFGRGAATGETGVLEEPKLAWASELPTDVGYPWFDSPLLAGGGKLFVVGRGGQAAALDLKSGEILWKSETNEPVFASPVMSAGVLLVPGRSLVALDTETGKERWRWQTDYGVSASPLVCGGKVFAVEKGEKLVALDPATGAKVWTARTSASTSAPVVLGDLVIIGTTEGLEWYRALDGSRRWTFPTAAPVTITPAVLADRIVIGDAARNLYAVATGEPTQLWHRRIPEGAIVETPVVYGDVVYFSTTGGTLRALRASDGADLWTRYVGCAVQSSPCVANGVLYFTAGTCFHAVECTEGDDLWRMPVTGVFSSPILVEGTLFAVTMDGIITAWR